LMCSPDNASKISKMRLRLITCDLSAPQKINVSSAYNRCDTLAEFAGLFPT